MQIRIKSIDELIQFIKSYDLAFNDYLKIISVFSEKPVLWISEKDRTKEDLIQAIERQRGNFERFGNFPPILDLTDILKNRK